MSQFKISIMFLIVIIYLTNCAVTVLAIELPEPNIYSASFVLIDADTGHIIHGNNYHEVLYPASVTKLMTALMLLEHTTNMEERITMSANAVFSIPRGSSHIAMDQDETLTVYESLLAIMLESANEVSNAIGEHIGGDLVTFGVMMSNRARELGALNTNFTNAHGLHHFDHFTTAYDVAIIKRELLTYPVFVEIIATTSATIPPTERQPLERILNNTHRMIQPHTNFFHEYTVGGKTGFTNEAMHTLATYARKDDMGLIVVVLNAARFDPFIYTAKLFDYGFSIYSPLQLFDHLAWQMQLDIKDEYGQIIGSTDIIARDSISKNMPSTFNLEKVELILDMPSYLNNGIEEGMQVGKLNIQYNDSTLADLNLYAINKIVNNQSLGTYISQVVDNIESVANGNLMPFFSANLIIIAVLATIMALLTIAFVITKYRRYIRNKRYMAARARKYHYIKRQPIKRGSARLIK